MVESPGPRRSSPSFMCPAPSVALREVQLQLQLHLNLQFALPPAQGHPPSETETQRPPANDAAPRLITNSTASRPDLHRPVSSPSLNMPLPGLSMDTSPRHALTEEAIALVSLSRAATYYVPPPQSQYEDWSNQQPVHDPAVLTIKKRKLEEAEVVQTSTTLPSLHDLIQSQQLQMQMQLQLQMQQQQGYDMTRPTTISTTPGSNSPSDPAALATKLAVPPELKCKYRTGKCNNIRALKSCGDYHNLCNHHRLRANANQRKLDRKKKVQRQQSLSTSSNAAGKATAASSPSSPVSTPAKSLPSSTASSPASTSSQ